MKKFVLLVLVLITGLTVFSQGIEFQKGRYAEVLEMAKKQVGIYRYIYLLVWTL